MSRSSPVYDAPTFRANDKTPPLLRALVDRLDDIDQLLLVLEDPIELVVVARPEIAHHVLVAVEEHDCHRVLGLLAASLARGGKRTHKKLVHSVELGDFVDVA